MTIFLNVLKKLATEKLEDIFRACKAKSEDTYYNNTFNNRALSLTQSKKVKHLQDQISQFQGTGNDKADYQEIIDMILKENFEIQRARDEANEVRDQGDTVKSLTALVSSTNAFYNRLFEIEFPLLNKVDEATPEGCIYYHAVYYFGEEYFTPASNDAKIREQKEAKVIERLDMLSSLIKAIDPNAKNKLEQQIKASYQVLAILASDNLTIIGGNKKGVALPFSFYGVQATLPSQWFNPKAGRFESQFGEAKLKIEGIETLNKNKTSARISEDKSASSNRNRDESTSPVSPLKRSPIKMFSPSPVVTEDEAPHEEEVQDQVHEQEQEQEQEVRQESINP